MVVNKIPHLGSTTVLGSTRLHELWPVPVKGRLHQTRSQSAPPVRVHISTHLIPVIWQKTELIKIISCIYYQYSSLELTRLDILAWWLSMSGKASFVFAVLTFFPNWIWESHDRCHSRSGGGFKAVSKTTTVNCHFFVPLVAHPGLTDWT